MSGHPNHPAGHLPAVHVLRHGETEWSATGRHTGRTDVPLTARGEQQALRVGTALTALLDAETPLVLTSPRQRAVRTALLAGLKIDERTEDLAEWDYGNYEGLTTPEIRETTPGWTVWTHPCPGGETLDEVTARADAVLARIRQAGRNVVLVGHGHFSRVLIACWLGLPANAGVHFGLDPAGLCELGHERGDPQIRRLNVPPWG